MDRVDRLVNSWVEEHLLPGAVLEIRMKGERLFQAAYGSALLTTVFDVASLTKVVTTLPSILLLAQSSQLTLQDPVQMHISEFLHPDVTIEHCLRHQSGLPASLPGYRERYAARDIRQEILAQRLEFKPGERVLYSDLGMILLGWIVTRITGIPFDLFVHSNILSPAGMKDSCFNPPAEEQERIAPTEWDGSKYLTGVVHDETCYRLGGVSGSAGLFSTASDIASYAQSWLTSDNPLGLTAASIHASLASPAQGRGLGWQVQGTHDAALACGRHWPEGSFGHTGFTGTSLWIDPERELTVVFLTNAVHYGRANAIKQLRPLLHDTVLASLTK